MAGPMGGQPGSGGASVPATASVVGNAFVNQYYHVLHQSPQVVHRFYTNASKLTRAEAGADGAVDTAESQSEIHNKVMLLDYSDFKAEIKTVDSQDSHEGGVIVMVTGSLSSKTSGKRNFVQTFFLAPQEKGYFVLNDIFRYLDEPPQVVGSNLPLSNGIPEPPQIHIPLEEVLEPALPTEHEVRELSSSPVSEDEAGGEESMYDLPERVEISEAEEDVASEDIVHVHHDDIPSPARDDPVSALAEPAAAQAPSEESMPGEIPKKSYASILRYMKEGGGVHVQQPVYSPAPKPSPPTPERPITVSVPPAPLPIQTPLAQDSFEENIPLENEADGRSVYVKNLPLNITAPQLEEEFARFGPVKPNGVNVKSQKQQGVCYAFVEFEDTSSAISAIEAGSISISGRPSYIEEKRPMTSRGGGRGRLPAGRGDRPFRTDGLRGRGSFLGGRGGFGGGRGAQDRDGAYRGRGAGQGRGGYGGGLGSNINNLSANTGGENNYRRNDSQGGNGARPVRRGSGNQLLRNVPLARDSTPAVPTA